MKLIIDIKDWKKTSLGWKNQLTGMTIKEKKLEDKFEYYDENDNYLGRYNSDTSFFKDDLILVTLDSEY